MERQLKERLVGAAVLIAVAVIMVPEMFSGSGSRESAAPGSTTPGATASDAGQVSESGQVKTYRIELQHRDTVSVSSESAAQASPVIADTRADAAAANTPVAPPTAMAVSSSSVAHASASSSTASIAHPVPAVVASVRSSASSSAQMPTVANAATGTWSVQIGSFSTESAAKQVQANVKSEGFTAFLSSVDVGGKTLHRVRVGAFADRDAAQAALNKLKRTYSQAAIVSPGH